MNRCVLIVIDSFGVGAMDDVPVVRPRDIDANTAWHLISRMDLRLPNLERLGLMNAIGKETDHMRMNPKATYAKSKLMHVGADTYQGHQEIMGTKPKAPVMQPFSSHIDQTEADLMSEGYSVRRFEKNGLQALVVNDCVFIGDNQETDHGQVINVSGTFKYTTFENVKKIGHIVRRNYEVSRIIALGGEDVEMDRILASVKTEDGFIGLDTPASGVYDKGYLVEHIGLGVDTTKQVPYCINKVGIHSYLYGKAADIIANANGTNFYGVDTAMLMDRLVDDFRSIKENTFFFLNVQETDLAGHACDPEKYALALRITDERLGLIIDAMDNDDMLIVMADHGNDPYSGLSFHTREYVPVLIRKPGLEGKFFGIRETMSDVGQTVACFFGTKLDNGTCIVPLNK